MRKTLCGYSAASKPISVNIGEEDLIWQRSRIELRTAEDACGTGGNLMRPMQSGETKLGGTVISALLQGVSKAKELVMLRNVPEITDEPADGSICAIEWTKWSIDEILDDYRANHLLETSVSLEQLPFGTVDRPEATWRSSKSVCPSSAPDSQEGNND